MRNNAIVTEGSYFPSQVPPFLCILFSRRIYNMFRIIIMTFSLIAVVLVNAAANIMPINGKTTGEISNSLPVLFTPAGYAFSIWAVIYLLLAIWLYGFMRNKVNC